MLALATWLRLAFSERDGTPSLMRPVFAYGAVMTITMVCGLITYLTIKDSKFPTIPADTGSLIAGMLVALLTAKVWQSSQEKPNHEDYRPTDYDRGRDDTDQLRDQSRRLTDPRGPACEPGAGQDARGQGRD